MWLRQIPRYILRIPSEALGVLVPMKISWMWLAPTAPIELRIRTHTFYRYAQWEPSNPKPLSVQNLTRSRLRSRLWMFSASRSRSTSTDFVLEYPHFKQKRDPVEARSHFRYRPRPQLREVSVVHVLLPWPISEHCLEFERDDLTVVVQKRIHSELEARPRPLEEVSAAHNLPPWPISTVELERRLNETAAVIYKPWRYTGRLNGGKAP